MGHRMCCMWRKPVKRNAMESININWFDWSSGSWQRFSVFALAMWKWNVEHLHRTSGRKDRINKSKKLRNRKRGWGFESNDRTHNGMCVEQIQFEHAQFCSKNAIELTFGMAFILVWLDPSYAYRSHRVHWKIYCINWMHRMWNKEFIIRTGYACSTANIMTMHIWYARSIYGLAANVAFSLCPLDISINANHLMMNRALEGRNIQAAFIYHMIKPLNVLEHTQRAQLLFQLVDFTIESRINYDQFAYGWTTCHARAFPSTLAVATVQMIAILVFVAKMIRSARCVVNGRGRTGMRRYHFELKRNFCHTAEIRDEFITLRVRTW